MMSQHATNDATSTRKQFGVEKFKSFPYNEAGFQMQWECFLTHWGRVTHICVGKLTIIGSDNGLAPGRRQAIIRTHAGILLIGILGTNFREILSEIHTFSFKKMHLKMSSGRWRPFCLGLNVLICIWSVSGYHFTMLFIVRVLIINQYR